MIGHDHIADFRFQQVPGMPGQFFDNKVIFPGVTAINYNQSGFSTFEMDDVTGKPSNLEFTFL